MHDTLTLMLRIIFFSILAFPTWSQSNLTAKGDAFIDYLSIYQQYVSGIKGGECAMIPSCSNYAIQAFKIHNPISAFVLTSDRLMRCGHDHKMYHVEANNGIYKLLDYLQDSANVPQPVYKRFAFVDTSRDERIKFIHYLMNKGLYNQALLKIQEHIFAKTFAATPSVSKDLYINFIRCLAALDKQEDAIFEYENTFPAFLKEDIASRTEIGICHFQLKNYQQAKDIWVNIVANTNDVALKTRANMLIGKSLSHTYNWREAHTVFSSIPNESFHKSFAMRNMLVLEKAMQQRYKKPAMAGVLSIVPGGGYLYAGYKQTALSAFLINGLFGYATYASIKNKNYGVAALTGTLSLAFYVGNIQGSVRRAKNHNNQLKQQFADNVNVNFNF